MSVIGQSWGFPSRWRLYEGVLMVLMWYRQGMRKAPSRRQGQVMLNKAAVRWHDSVGL